MCRLNYYINFLYLIIINDLVRFFNKGTVCLSNDNLYLSSIHLRWLDLPSCLVSNPQRLRHRLLTMYFALFKWRWKICINFILFYVTAEGLLKRVFHFKKNKNIY